jgi:hypothetical protein
MLENIVASIIYTDFQRSFKDVEVWPSSVAMKVKFSLSCDWNREEGYRNLEILIFGGGSNYIGVYAKIDWNVKDLVNIHNSAKGDTDWVLVGYHDSCWREAVSNLMQEFSNRIITIDSLFNRGNWYDTVVLSTQNEEHLDQIRKGTPGYGNVQGEQIKVQDLEFWFPEEK